ncbi:hypothetical protein [Phenylobacterium sp.]|uniref:hypothetical protein n=1 Tax=Phenylobacterium sp. TaxID=1871053 RepID=UPI0025CB927A|nr:hypothetical protein [Phenylobacterium sp.]
MDMKGSAIIWLALLVMGLAVVAPVFAHVPPPVTSADYAAWVQGLGTVLAVSVGVWISLAPARRQARDRAQAKLDLTLDLIEALDRGTPAIRRLEASLVGGQVSAARVALKALEASGLQGDLAQLIEEPRAHWPDQSARSQARLLSRLLLTLRADQLLLDIPSAAAQSVWIRQVEDQLQLIQGVIVGLSSAIGRPIDPPRSGGAPSRTGRGSLASTK